MNPHWSEHKILYACCGLSPKISTKFKVFEKPIFLDFEKNELLVNAFHEYVACSFRLQQPEVKSTKDELKDFRPNINVSVAGGQSQWALGGGWTFTGQEESTEKKDSNLRWKLKGLEFANCSVGAALHGVNLTKPKKTGAKPYRWDASLVFTVRNKLEEEQLLKEGKEKLEEEQLLKEGKEKLEKGQHKRLMQLVELIKGVELVKEGKEKVKPEQHKKLKTRLAEHFKEELVKEGKEKLEQEQYQMHMAQLVEHFKEVEKELTFSFVGHSDNWKHAFGYTRQLNRAKNIYKMGVHYKVDEKTYLTVEFDNDWILQGSVEHNTEDNIVLKFSCAFDLPRRSLWTGIKVFPSIEVKKMDVKEGGAGSRA